MRALALACLAGVLSCLPYPGTPLAAGTAVVALTVAWLEYRKPDARQRLAAAGAFTIAGLAVILVCLRLGGVIVALGHVAERAG